MRLSAARSHLTATTVPDRHEISRTADHSSVFLGPGETRLHPQSPSDPTLRVFLQSAAELFFIFSFVSSFAAHIRRPTPSFLSPLVGMHCASIPVVDITSTAEGKDEQARIEGARNPLPPPPRPFCQAEGKGPKCTHPTRLPRRAGTGTAESRRGTNGATRPGRSRSHLCISLGAERTHHGHETAESSPISRAVCLSAPASCLARARTSGLSSCPACRRDTMFSEEPMSPLTPWLWLLPSQRWTYSDDPACLQGRR